jgi:predicted 3-demethylubiquinone-9 3-methyltransferase (glyoxalase superfamily)
VPSQARINPCLWFDKQAEEAANCYIGIFKNSKITDIGRYGEAVSLQVWCKDQSEVDYFWEKLGDQKSAAGQRAMNEMMRQKKPDIAALQKAYNG